MIIDVSSNKKSSSGFTLIELFVVISIIGLLSSIVLASINSARVKARNARRMSDLIQVRNALQLYYEDHESYPSTVEGGFTKWRSECWAHVPSLPSDQVIPGLVPTYMSQFPSDPLMNKPAVENINCYLYSSNGTGYTFRTRESPDLNNVPPTVFSSPTGQKYWGICEVSPQCIW
ncbi:MAG: prepilin-type N-terminal cleavage/methylation domain-containing protein [Candidatus Taylorbacteria bacterium]|nr:prepilin-type N-terminal cleavage/methylation domain-containing protein [Candidatus Taylorbacteria bacterium]